MRYVFLVLLSFSVLADDYCYCNLYAVKPLAAAREVEDLKLTQVRLDYFENYSEESRLQCVESCRMRAAQEVRLFNEDIELWSKKLIVENLHGKHCTGPTDVKVPVRAKATLGDYSLGLAHQSIVFIHLEQACKL